MRLQPRLFEEDVVEMTSEQLHWLMDGYDVWSRPHMPVTFRAKDPRGER
jgi:hypothetical protein